MSIDHVHHHCECDHGEVKYCKTCKVAYCRRCGKEWRDTSTWTPTWLYSNQLAPQPRGTTTYPNPHPPGTVLCRHEG
jgi:hypothetical protein